MFVAEAEFLMNSRPLTYVSSDCNDLEAITPNHFLLGRANLNIPLDVVSDADLETCLSNGQSFLGMLTPQMRAFSYCKTEMVPQLLRYH